MKNTDVDLLFFAITRQKCRCKQNCNCLRALFPETRIIWCSELDFSLHAFRLRVDYFLLEPITEEAFRHGLYVWVEEKQPSASPRADHNQHSKEDHR